MTRDRPKSLAPKLLAIREYLGMSQSQLAARMQSKPYYTRISEFERGRRTPNLLILLDYARVAEIHVDDLIDDEIELQF